ncbi:MAG: Gfo/Idh/MocA family oxidoreductase [Candidatus Latescibacterota bacterium]|nr:MAG: Gfo/Idh/MocA family oxidoreductase [Candidatus Latescibacterota bacterium]
MGLNVGVIGTGKLGRHHVRILKRVPEVDFVGCFDILGERSSEAASSFGAEAFDSVDGLLEAVDHVSIVVPTVNHAEVALRAFESGKNVFLEKPIAATVDEGKTIVEAARDAGCILQIGHVERFNEAIAKCRPYINSPSFVEFHRLAPFNIRGTDVSVVMDLMIHDIDLLTYFLGEMPVEVRAKGAAVITDGPDIVSARLEYASGCVANLTTSRVSLEPMRKVRVFSTSRYLSIDLFEGKIKHFQKGDSYELGVAMLKEDKGKLQDVSLHDFFKIDETVIEGEEPLFNELQSFCRTLSEGTAPEVSGSDGLNALILASEIQRIVEADATRVRE